MPSNFLTADTSFPQLNGQQSTDEKFALVTDYLYLLLEQLRYTLANLGQENFNSAELDNIADMITQPVYLRLQDDEGNITALQATAQGLATRISDAEGNVSALTQTAKGLETRVSDAEGNISTLAQTVDSFTLSVSNGTDSSTIQLLANGVVVASKVIRFSGMVSFTDLETPGATTICGGNIDTDTLQVNNLYGTYVYLRNNSGLALGRLSITGASTSYAAVDLESYGALRLTADYGNVYIESNPSGTYINMGSDIAVGNGNFKSNLDAQYSCGTSGARWSDVYAENGVSQTSDLTRKKDVTYGLDAYDGFFDGLRPMSYRFLNGHGRLHLGLGAQDVERLLADCGLTGMDFAGFVKSPKVDDAGNVIEGEYNYSLRYTELIPLLIWQVQTLKARVKEWEEKLS